MNYQTGRRDVVGNGLVRPCGGRSEAWAPAALRRLAIVAASLLALGCPTAGDPPSPDPEQVDLLAAGINRIREQLQEVPGRTGILAEESVYSVFDEELIIRDYFQDRRDGFFLDVGCAWPVRWSNTYYLEERLGWAGIGVDALADYGPEWIEKRPRSKFFSYLVTDHSDTEDSFYTSPERPGISSTDRLSASGRRFGFDIEPEEVKVTSITLDALLEREGVEKLDLLAMDIEGHELEALAGFDIERFQPKLAVIEGKDPAVAQYFERHGYALIERYLPYDLVNRYFERRPSGD